MGRDNNQNKMAQNITNGVTTTQNDRCTENEEYYDPNNDPKEVEKHRLIENIKSIVGQKGIGKEPLNIVVLGCPGSGKSAFLNTVFTSLRKDYWSERARVGCFGANGQQVTKHVMSFTSKSHYYQEEPGLLLPTFIDVQGLENDDNTFNAGFLRALLNGKIRNNQSMEELHSIFDNDGLGKLKSLLNRQKDNLKIDRIIVVASVDPTEALPKTFLQCIHDAMQSKRDIPMFGVLTRADKFERNDDRITTFRNALGITEDRFLLVANYCPDIDQQMRYHNNVFPYIDVPVLKFLKQVVNPQLRVITPNTSLKDTDWIELFKSNISSPRPYLMLQIVLIMFFLWWLTCATLSPDKLNIICAEYDAFANKHDFKISELDLICSDKKKVTTFPVSKVFVFLICIVCILPIVDRHEQLILEIFPLPERIRTRVLDGNFDLYIYAGMFLILSLILIVF